VHFVGLFVVFKMWDSYFYGIYRILYKEYVATV